MLSWWPIFFTQCYSLALLTHSQRKQQYFVQPSWRPSKMAIIFRSCAHSSYTFHIGSHAKLFSNFHNIPSWWLSIQYGIDGCMFPICSKTTFKLDFEESMNNLHSFESCLKPTVFISPSISEHTQRPLCMRKNCSTSCCRILKYVTLVALLNRFHCCRLDPKSTASFFDKCKCRTRSLR